MNNKKGIVKEEGSQAPEELDEVFTPIPKETLRYLSVIATECELVRLANESDNDETNIESHYIPSANNMKFSTAVFIAIVQALGTLSQEMHLDIITKQNALNHKLNELINKTATILSRTYIELGDGAEFADDEALLMIRDLLLTFDSTIIHRARFRKITGDYKSGYKFGKSK